jgi:hypothetical protein
MFASETVDHNKVAVISRGFVRIISNKEWRVPGQGGQRGKRNRRALRGDERQLVPEGNFDDVYASSVCRQAGQPRFTSYRLQHTNHVMQLSKLVPDGVQKRGGISVLRSC